MAWAIKGRVIGMTRADPERIDRATVWITENGQIDAITPSTAPAPSGFEHVPVIDVGDDLIVPGLIDLHNHLGYNTLPLWAVTDRPEPFAHHDIWPGAKTYGPEISKPAHVLAYADPEALLAYVEVKALVGGTTSIQGSPAANKPLDGWLTRNIDDESFGTHNRNLVLASALTEDRDALGDRSAKLDGASIFVYHCAEGQHDSLVRREFDDVVKANCLKPGFVGVHCSALQPADFTTWTAKATNAHNPGALAWSPFSNLWLYGETTDIAAARKAGLRVCLGSDWSPSGTRHVLGELKVASIWNEEAKLGLTAVELIQMCTTNPGEVLEIAWGAERRVGRLQVGSLADLMVVAADAGNATVNNPSGHERLLGARERDVKLVAIAGRPLYGTKALLDAAGAVRTSAITVAGQRRRIAIDRLDTPVNTPPKAWLWTDVVKRINTVRKDPAAAVEAARKRREQHGGPGPDPNEPAPLRIVLDMPGGGDDTAGPPPDPGHTFIPAPDGLTHDQPFFASINGRGYHGGVLDRLASFYAP